MENFIQYFQKETNSQPTSIYTIAKINNENGFINLYILTGISDILITGYYLIINIYANKQYLQPLIYKINLADIDTLDFNSLSEKTLNIINQYQEKYLIYHDNYNHNYLSLTKEKILNDINDYINKRRCTNNININIKKSPKIGLFFIMILPEI